MRGDERKPLATREGEIVDRESRRATERAAASEDAVAPTVDQPTPAVGEPARDVLFPNEESAGYRSRWEAIQTGFVDEPRAAVEQADALVAQVVSRLSEVFSRERQTLEQQWGRGDNLSTEDLRVALKRYRSFFDRLLSV